MRARERYEYILSRKDKWPVKLQCEILEISESGYYRFIKNLGKPSKDEAISAAIKRILEEDIYNDNYGVPRMQLALKQRGINVGIRKLKRIMKEMGLIHEKKRRPHGLTKATTEAQEKENLIKQKFTAKAPLSLMLTDISQIQCYDGKLYISPILDCFNGEILSLQMRSNMKKELCIDTVKAIRGKSFPKGAILHSDRGSQYTSEEFRKTLEKKGIKQSLSGVDHCYDNARMESFFATLKKELLYRLPTYKMRMEEVKRWIFHYVFTYYNRKRVYTSNPGGLPPAAYRRLQEEQLLAA